MRSFVFILIAGLFVVTLVAAVIFRSRRAWDTLHFLRKMGWVYVLVIIAAAAYRLWF